MRDEQRLLLAFILIGGLLFGYQLLFPTAPAPQTPSSKDVAVEHQFLTQADSVTDQTAAALPFNKTANGQSVALQTPAVFATTTLETEKLRIEVEGNTIKKLYLKDYKQTTKPDSPDVDLCDTIAEPCYMWGYEDFGQPTRVEVIGQGTPVAIRSVWQRPEGVFMSDLRPGSDYRLKIEFYTADVTGKTTFAPYILSVEDITEVDRYDFHGLRFFRAGKMESIALNKLEALHRWEEKFSWVMWDHKYFTRAILAPDATTLLRVQTAESANIGAKYAQLKLNLPIVPAQTDTKTEVDLFTGPKEEELLRQVGHNLQESIDLGWTSAIARLMLALLRFFHDLTGNYGWGIILLTLVVKVVLYPLTYKSYHSMQALGKLKPKMEELQKKYKDDRSRLNQEMINLYKGEKINPLGGCLPMILQIPIFFALYKVLLISIELRQAPFIGWIQDLSMPEDLVSFALYGTQIPIRILPLIMGVSMFIQQKMTPTTIDPQQQKILMLMPIIFTFIFYGFPSGLVLYWLTNNVVTIAQQWWIQRRSQTNV